MTYNEFLDLIIFVLKASGFILGAVFCIRYSKRPWRSTPEGWHLMSFTALIATFMLFAAIGDFLVWADPMVIRDGDYGARRYVGIVLYTAINFLLFKRNELLRDGKSESE